MTEEFVIGFCAVMELMAIAAVVLAGYAARDAFYDGHYGAFIGLSLGSAVGIGYVIAIIWVFLPWGLDLAR